MEAEGEGITSQVFDSRGWAMRRGHCKALSRRRNPKAPCALRGRNAFSRTVNANVNGYKDLEWRRPGCIAREIREEIIDSCTISEEESWYCAAWAQSSDLEQDGQLTRAPRSGACRSQMSNAAEESMRPPRTVSQDDEQCRANKETVVVRNPGPYLPMRPIGLLRQRSEPCTDTEFAEAKESAAQAYVPLQAWCAPCLTTEEHSTAGSSKPTKIYKAHRWEQAAAKADSLIEACKQTPSGGARSSPTRQERRVLEQKRVQAERKLLKEQFDAAWKSIMSARKVRRERAQTSRCKRMSLDIQQHLDHHQALVKDGRDTRELEKSLKDTFSCFQQRFLTEHRCRILKCLAGNEDRVSHELKPADLSLAVQLRFLKAWTQLGGPEASVRPVFHGTDPRNIASIFARGLLIPGLGNELRVVHGSAHGLGIYTAMLDSASLSRGFGGRKGMLVCAVLDDAEQLPVPQTMGRRTITAESAAVRHVGGAVVVFDERRVAPLFHAEASRNLHSVRLGRPDLCRKKENKKRHRTSSIAMRRSGFCESIVSFVTRRAARRHRVGRGLGRSGVGASGLASASQC